MKSTWKRWSWVSSALATVLIAGPLAGQATMDSWYVNTGDVEGTKRMLVALGGTANGQMVEFPGVTVHLNAAAPSGGTVGTSVDHVGLWVPNVEAAFAKWQAAGVPVELARATQAWVLTPEGLRIEVLQNDAQTAPVQHHHIHYNVPRAAITDAQKWYNEVFGAVPGMRGNFQAADIPGANLTFSGVDEERVGTRGRALDRVGFKVQGLEALCQRIQGRADVKLDRPCQREGSGIVRAQLTDPWGTVIELTEGGVSN